MTDLVQKLVGALERLLNSDPDGAIATASEDDLTLAANDMDADPVIREQAASVLQARAALTAAKAGGWLPIETAPKDGTVVLLCRGERVTAGHWEPERWPTEAEYHSSTGEYLGSFETGECIDAWWYSEDGGFSEDEPPTHWQPLPTPPKEQSAGGLGLVDPVAHPRSATK